MRSIKKTLVDLLPIYGMIKYTLSRDSELQEYENLRLNSIKHEDELNDLMRELAYLRAKDTLYIFMLCGYNGLLAMLINNLSGKL